MSRRASDLPVAGRRAFLVGASTVAASALHVRSDGSELAQAGIQTAASGLSVLDFIPAELHAAIRARAETPELDRYVQTAIQQVASLGGGILYFPLGTYRFRDEIRNARFVSLRGDGPTATILLWPAAHRGHGIRQTAPLNSSSVIRLLVQDLAIGSMAGAAASRGAGFYDQAGVELSFVNVNFGGWRYGAILDQSELVDFDRCAFNACRNGVWLVNGEDSELGNTGAQAAFTNRISVLRSQFSSISDICIINDGGQAHAFNWNNFNNGSHAVRVAGSSNVEIRGNYFEGLKVATILLSARGRTGGASGISGAVAIESNNFAPLPGTSAVRVEACGQLSFDSNFIAGVGAPVIAGAGNCASLFTRGNTYNSRELTDGRAAYVNDLAELRRN